MEGHVSADGREALIDLRVFSGANGRGLTDVRAVIDTGFTGFLTLPSATIQSLSLLLFGSREVVLADGSVSSLDVYRAEILWHDEARPVSVLQSEGGPLIGMSLLRGSSLRMDIMPGGSVKIEEWGWRAKRLAATT
jgi:clan AA aspartic protease